MLKRRWITGLMAAALIGGGLAPASAGADPLLVAQGGDDPFASLVGKRSKRSGDAGRSNIERYVTTSGDRVFLLENRGDEAFIKFLCGPDDPRLDCKIDPEGPSEEIIALTASRGSRGDFLYLDDAGETVLRVAAHGGATVLWPGEDQTRGASKGFGDDQGAFDLPAERRGDAHRRAQGAAANLSAVTGSPIVFDVGRRSGRDEGDSEERGAVAAPAPRAFAEQSRTALSFAADAASPAALESDMPARDSGDATVLADAVARVAGGMHRVAGDPTGARIIGARIAVVRFIEAPAASLSLDGAVLTVFYDPASGVAGRPSSTAVAKFLEESL